MMRPSMAGHSLVSAVLLAVGLVATSGCGSLPTHRDGSAKTDGPVVVADAKPDGPVVVVGDAKPDGPVIVVPDVAPDQPSGVAPDAAPDALIVDPDAGPDGAMRDGADAPGEGPVTRATGWADERVRALVAQMTFAEKIQQLAQRRPGDSSLGLAGVQLLERGPARRARPTARRRSRRPSRWRAPGIRSCSSGSRRPSRTRRAAST